MKHKVALHTQMAIVCTCGDVFRTNTYAIAQHGDALTMWGAHLKAVRAEKKDKR